MGKKRIIKKSGGGMDSGLKSRSLARSPKRKVELGVLYVQSTYNNTSVVLTDRTGGTLCWSSSGALGFKGAKKGTPFAAAKVGELIGEKAQVIISKGISIGSIQDATPVPHNGPKLPKPRRV
jgi:small subunit ribosomal protein S11